MEIYKIDSSPVSLENIRDIMVNRTPIALSDEAKKKIKECREFLDKTIDESPTPIYGITTGFGSLCNVYIDKESVSQLQKNLVCSHACGTGDPVPQEIVMLILLLKIISLSKGFSGVQVETVQRLIDFFNNDVCPVVFQQGSLGASGDLSPLAHLSLPLLGLGQVYYNGKIHDSKSVLDEFGWKPIELKSKEGLALLNGTQFMSAYGVWSVMSAERLLNWADLIGAMSLDAFDGRIEPFSKIVNDIRPYKGQIHTASNFRRLLKGSELIKQDKKNVQDPYSFRCIPQVHGASRDAVSYAKGIMTIEVNSVTDNPTIFVKESQIISAGNFHGEPLAITMDFMAMALAELGNIAERRIYQLISGERGLPKFLVAKPGLNSGFMIPQYTAASIVSQSKQLSTPASVDSIPSSQGQEDHVSMGANAATKLSRVVMNTERILAIELFNAAQALEFRRPLKSSKKIEEVWNRFRDIVPFIEDDTVMYPFIEKSIEFIRTPCQF